ncbi:MAG: nucleotidyl transferase AbiEii/AbiGii toxin family protein [Bacteroidales bacterium]|nr:nucleotidyl transferase AbiEii/AbiGii toxin family protein [Bacteroidales bacterium]
MPTNIEMLQIVANGLEELKDRFVFVGGAVAELYADDPAASDIRATKDIDCVVELSSKMAYANLEEKLRSKGFAHDTSQNAPICRWIYEGIKVDVMPTDEDILGFNNKWYSAGVENKTSKTLPDGTEIFVFPVEYYLASKFEAHKDRGGSDLRQSHDFEDIIYIFDNCVEILTVIKNADEEVKKYIKSECLILLDDDNLSEGITCALSLSSDSDRTEIIEELIWNIAHID